MGSVLKLDFDWTPPQKWVDWKLFMLTSLFGEHKVVVTQTKRGFHLIITVPDNLTEEEICMWQWVFGDDQDRARLNYARMKNGVKNWNKLFERKIEK